MTMHAFVTVSGISHRDGDAHRRDIEENDGQAGLEGTGNF